MDMVLRGSKTKGKEAQHFIYGGIAGGCSRTIVAPLDRVKILMQTGTNHTMRQMFRQILKKEGVFSLWKGNVLNCARIIPYSALQFGTYDICKSIAFSEPLSVPQRLSCGAAAGFVATTVTHPIDVIRHRLLMNADIHTFGQAWSDIMGTSKTTRSLFKGYGSTVSGLVPFIAVNFCTFDTLKFHLKWTSTPGILGMGALAALISQSVCYPLDTVRRRMQIRGTPYKHGVDAFIQIIKREGFLKLYAGISANALKIVPNNSIRFLVYELCRRSLDFE